MYNKNIELKQNFKKTIIGTETVLRIWWQRTFTLESKISIFKILALLKFVFLAQVLLISNEINTTIQRIQKNFPWTSIDGKIKCKTICNDFQNGGSEIVDISSKISSLQCSWVKKLYDQNSHDRKLIPLHFINNAFAENFIFHSSLSFKTSVLNQFPTFYANILQSWKIYFSHISYTPSCTWSQFLWFNNYITIDNNSVHYNEFSSHITLSISYLISGREIKDWNHIKKIQLTYNLYYKFRQMLHAILKK